MCVCCIVCVRLRNGYTRACMQKLQHTHTYKAVTGHMEAKKLLSCRRQLDYINLQEHRIGPPIQQNWSMHWFLLHPFHIGESILILNHTYRIHSNKRPGCLDKSFLDGCLFVLIFVGRIKSKIYDFGHYQANSQHIELRMFVDHEYTWVDGWVFHGL